MFYSDGSAIVPAIRILIALILAGCLFAVVDAFKDHCWRE